MSAKEQKLFDGCKILLDDGCPPDQKYYRCRNCPDDTEELQCKQCWSEYLFKVVNGDD